MIKIAYVIDGIATPSGGTEGQLLALLHGLDRRDFEPTLLCLRPSDWLSTQQFPFDVVVLNVGALLRSSMLSALSRFRMLQRRKRFDILQTFFFDANVFGTVAGRWARVPIVVPSRRNLGYQHGALARFDPSTGQTRAQRRILRFLRPWTTHYLANSRAAMEATINSEGVSPDKISVVYNGVDLAAIAHADGRARRQQRKAWAIGDDEVVVGTVANLRPVKNIPALIGAARELGDDFSQTRFVVVGEGPERSDLQRQITAAGLEGRFHLVGAHSEAYRCLAAFDIAVQCSTAESFSTALIEYMAAGLPIAASAVGGNPEAITHGETGLLYSLEDAAGLAACLRRLLEDPAAAEQMGRAARQVASQCYSSASSIEAHQEFYRRIVAAISHG